MNDFLANYLGLIILLGLPVCGLVLAVSSLLLRSTAREMCRLADDVRSDPRFNKADREWLNAYLDEAKDRSICWVAAISPILLLLGPYWAGDVAITLMRDGEEAALNNLRDDLDKLEAKIIKEQYGTDISGAGLLRDWRKRRLDDLVQSYQVYSHPFAALWMAVFAIPMAVTFMLFGGVFGLGLRGLRALFRKLFRPSVSFKMLVSDR